MQRLLTFIIISIFIFLSFSVGSDAAPRKIEHHISSSRNIPNRDCLEDPSDSIRHCSRLNTLMQSAPKDSLDSIWVAIPYSGHPLYYHKSLVCPKLKALKSYPHVKIWDQRHAIRKYKPCRECCLDHPSKYPPVRVDGNNTSL